MNGKLTLTLEKSLIDEAKKIAKSSGKSISEMIGGFITEKISQPAEAGENSEISPIVSALKGSFAETKTTASTRKTMTKPAAKTPVKRAPKNATKPMK